MEVVKEEITIYALVKLFPKSADVMKNLGFLDIVRPGMLQTVGRVMTLKKGCKMKKINYNQAKMAFLDIGITFE
ncbi:MAG: DUF1858 domain-containing protein [Bacillota bacterium]